MKVGVLAALAAWLLVAAAAGQAGEGTAPGPSAPVARADAGHAQGSPSPAPSVSSELAGAGALFERNLDAIRGRDTAAYLSCYLRAETLARTGPGGFALGYQGLAASAGQGWPDHFDAQDLKLVSVAPGVVYGTYRYRVRFGADEQTGLSERLFLNTLDGWRIAVSTAFPAPAGTPPPARALVGGTLVDGTGAAPLADAVVVLAEGKIVCAGSRAACPIAAEMPTFDAHGLWLVPGLVDAHVHFSQSGWADARPDALDLRAQHPYEDVVADLASHPERFARSLLCSGITAAFDVGGYPWTLGLPARLEADTRSARVVATGPLLSTVDHWLNLAGERQFLDVANPETARSQVRYLQSAGAAAVKLWLIVEPNGPPLEQLAAIAAAASAEAKSLGLPLVVHATGLAEAKLALRAGAKVLVHSVWDRPVDEEFLELLRSSAAIYTPTLTVDDGYQRMLEATVGRQTPAVDDPNGCVAPEILARVAEAATVGSGDDGADDIAPRLAWTQERARLAAENLRRVVQAGLPIALGTDAGNPLTLHGPSVYVEAEAMQAAGMTPSAVLVAATKGGAHALGREAELGTIEAGKLADLVLLAADPTANISALRRLRYVVRGGELRPLEELRPGREQ